MVIHLMVAYLEIMWLTLVDRQQQQTQMTTTTASLLPVVLRLGVVRRLFQAPQMVTATEMVMVLLYN